MQAYRDADAMEDISDLPAFKNIDPQMRSATGKWAAYQTANWCMAYNTKRIKKSELPKTWKDLVKADSGLTGGRVGAAPVHTAPMDPKYFPYGSPQTETGSRRSQNPVCRKAQGRHGAGRLRRCQEKAATVKFNQPTDKGQTEARPTGVDLNSRSYDAVLIHNIGDGVVAQIRAHRKLETVLLSRWPMLATHHTEPL